ncbi:MAG: triple tyrosine motif-containing protein [Daejeonella sp.]
MKVFLVLILTVLFVKSTLGQNQIGTPQIINYNTSTYKAGTQNWDIAQDKFGTIYFGNNEGLLTFNGKFWNLYPLPNRTVVRSLEIDKNGRIYVGGQDELGYFFPDQSGKLIYHSLKDLIPVKDRQFADIWNINIIRGQVFFRSLTKLIHLKDGIIKILNPENSWVFLGEANGQLFVQEKIKGLLTYQNGIWKPVCNDPILSKITISSIMEYNDGSFLVTTLKNGLFILEGSKLTPKPTSEDQSLFNDRIYCATVVNKDWYAFGTTSGGVLIMNKAGKLIQKYSFDEGLQKNNVRSVYIDQNKNLWIGQDDGIDFMAINSAITQIYPDKNKQVTSYAVKMFNNRLFIGTSNGLFQSSEINPSIKDISQSPGYFEEVKNTKGQVWGLEEINNNLMLAHEDGAFVIKNNFAEQLYNSPGTWLFLPMANIFPSQNILSGTYTGLQLINYEQGKFLNAGSIPGVNDPLRFLIYNPQNNTAWASHPYHGVYEINLSGDFKKINKVSLYTKKDGLPTTLYNYVFKIKSRIVVATSKGVYEFDEKEGRFIKSPEFYEPLKDIPIQYLKEDPNGNVWFVSEKQIGIIDYNQPSKGKSYSIFYFPELSSKVVSGFENIYPVDNNNIFIGANKGVIHLNYQKYIQNIRKLNVFIGQVRVSGKADSILFGGYFLKDNQLSATQDLGKKVEVPKNKYNSIHFEFASTLFEQKDNIQFSYQLVGFDKTWSPWTEKSEKDYTNLPSGHYTFKVKSRNNLGNSSEPASYSFEVLPFWYLSYMSFIVYLIFLIGIVNYIRIWQRKRHIKEKEKLKYLHQLEMESQESEIVKLKNEKLEDDVNFKNKELASTTMHLVQRGKVLTKIKEVVSNLEKMSASDNNSAEFKQIFRLLNEVEKRDADWEQFSIYFDHVHSNFLADMKDRHPGLTPNELKLCAYMKMNLTSKEMAQLMSITVRAVEVSRYRLRKKLNIPTEVNLFDYLMQTVDKEVKSEND